MLQYNTLLRNFIFLYSRYISADILANSAGGDVEFMANTIRVITSVNYYWCQDMSYVIVMIIIVSFAIIVSLILLTERQRSPSS